jgi:hypothetical protein
MTITADLAFVGFRKFYCQMVKKGTKKPNLYFNNAGVDVGLGLCLQKKNKIKK